MHLLSRIAATLSVLLFTALCSPAALALEEDSVTVSPVRLSYVEGNASFWRYGAEDWVNAQLNTPLATGDALYVGKGGNLELQMGSRAFVRADDDTQFSLLNQATDFIQFKVTSGRVSFDLRSLPAGYSVEVDTPNAVFTIDRIGYYRVDVNGDVRFVTRRGGQASMVAAGGQPMSIRSSEEIVVQGTNVARAETYVAPELDQWDRWNYDRTDGLVDAVSERYLPAEMAGASDLDHYGSWRVVTEYGPVWMPEAVAPGWAPYSTGRWIWDPYYQWTWIDDAPWGWAPFHYGRWINLGGYWAWAPGPVVRHAVYSPALVAFYGVSPNVSVGLSIGSSGVGWVALSWGEPLTPWWGRPRYIGRPTWGGWGGPRIVNNTVVNQTTVINVTNITYNNSRINNAVIATTREHFGKGRINDAQVRVTQTRDLVQVRGALPVKPEPASLVAGAHKGIRPPESMLSRQVVATRPPRESALPWRTESPRPETQTVPERQQYVPVPKRTSNDLPRPEFGAQTGAERARPPLLPRFEERRRAVESATTGRMMQKPTETGRTEFNTQRTAPVESASPARNMREATPPRVAQEPSRMQIPPETRRSEVVIAPVPRATPEAARKRAQTGRERTDLPGKPANRMYRGQNKENQNKENVEQRRSQQ